MSVLNLKLQALIEAAARRLAEKQASSTGLAKSLEPKPLVLAIQEAIEPIQVIQQVEPYDFFTVNGLVLNEQQRKAVQWFGIENKSGCLIGPAGTGKTTTVRAIIRAMMHLGRVPILPKTMEHKYMVGGTPGIWGGSFTRIATRNLRDNVPDELAQNIHNVHRLLEFEPVFYDVIDPETGKVKTIVNFEPKRNRIKTLHPSIKVFFLDESSMIGVELHQMLMDAVGCDNAQFIYIGDLAQLPPVFGPAILGYKLLELPVVELTEVYRHAGRIVELANYIRVGNTIPSMRSMLAYRGTKFAKNLDKIRELARKEVAEKWNGTEDGSTVTIQYLSERLTEKDDGYLRTLQKLGKFFTKEYNEGRYIPETDIILIPFNVNVGTIEINNFIADALAVKHKRVVHEIISGKFKQYLAIGDKVFYDREEAEIIAIKRNDSYMGRKPLQASEHMTRWGGYRKMINAAVDDGGHIDIDALLSSVKFGTDESEVKNQASHVITVRKFGEELEYELNTAGQLNELLMGYALTVHKSQGSQWRKVYIVFHNSHNARLQREMVYTAITRAQKELHVICEPESFVIGVESQSIKGNTLAEKAEFFKGKVVDDKKRSVKQDLLAESDGHIALGHKVKIADTVPEDIQQRCVDMHLRMWTHAKRHYNNDPRLGNIPEMDFNMRSKNYLGMAWYDKNRVAINPVFVSCSVPSIVDYVINNTIPHELAHHIANRIYGHRGHGEAWVQVMEQCFNLPGSRVGRIAPVDFASERERMVLEYFNQVANDEGDTE